MTAVLADVLIDYRRHPDAITVKKRAEQTANLQLTGTRNLRKRLPENVVQDLEPLLAMLAHKLPANGATIAAVVKGCNTMLAYDLPRAPSRAHRIWAKRTAAGLLALAILSRGGSVEMSDTESWQASTEVDNMLAAPIIPGNPSDRSLP